jgi:hypothetical protein
MTARTATTAEAAYLLGIDPRNVARWARTRGIEPLRRQRIGRSYVTVWSLDALSTAALTR